MSDEELLRAEWAKLEKICEMVDEAMVYWDWDTLEDRCKLSFEYGVVRFRHPFHTKRQPEEQVTDGATALASVRNAIEYSLEYIKRKRDDCDDQMSALEDLEKEVKYFLKGDGDD